MSISTALRDPDVECWIYTLTPARPITHLSHLRQIVACQELFFCVSGFFNMCDLPASIEEIGVVDTTFALHRWAEAILDMQAAYPKLRCITI
ncbi:hypothetical protein EK21DRAFT_71479 [Setomelanomma holmii]|uniref:Uncharacterized protein n=1 Tax=Setomelanomma holmii TaxID=210430 RepID=A0A9P4H4X3_9PLEO|nr:hypothetical protein EK21DRAFT_71479 [Setomelanomma holmii]